VRWGDKVAELEQVLAERFVAEFHDINTGKYRCVDRFFRAVLRTIQGDAVLVLRKNSRRWEIINEVREGHVESIREIAEVDELQDWLEEVVAADRLVDSREFKIGAIKEGIVCIPVLLRPVRGIVPDVHIMLLERPRGLMVEPIAFGLGRTLLLNVKLVRSFVISWFSWASYERQRRDSDIGKVCDNGNSERAAAGGNLEGITGKLTWPMTFQEVADVVERRWPLDREKNWSLASATKWCSAVVEKPCEDCKPVDEARRQCKDDEQRKSFEILAPFLKWRLAYSADGEIGKWDLQKKDFEKIEGIGSAFLGQCDPERLNGKALSCFFADRFWDEWLGDEQRMELRCSAAAGPGERVKTACGCTYVMHHLLGDTQLDGKTIESIAWAVSRYGHDVLGIEPRIDIVSHLLFEARNEPGLHMLRQYYRDHFFHAIEVCFLGHFLLELRIKKNWPLWKEVAIKLWGRKEYDRTPKIEVKRKVLKLWYVAALLHDAGYGIDALKGLRELLNFFRNSEPLKELAKNLENAVDTLSQQQEKDGFAGYEAKDKPGEDHGVVGARHLQGLLEAIKKDDLGFEAKEYEPAVWAIALHSHRKQTVRFDKQPLAFLLILCDTVQEWNRPRLDYATAPVEILAWLQGQGQGWRDLRGPFKNATVKNVSKVGKTFGLNSKANSKVHLILDYDERINSNAGVFNLWLDASCNFQRLDFTGLGKIDIDIEYVTPVYRNPRRGLPEMQLHRLQDAARETHMGFLEKWFPAQEVGDHVTNGAVEYWEEGTNGQAKKDHLVLHLRRLCETKRITKDIDAFRDRLKKWKRYNEDRDFSGDYAPAVPD
jgi:hypothetical protein